MKQYRSSSITILYKFITPIGLAVFVFIIISTWNLEDGFSYAWSRLTAIIIGWSFIWVIVIIYRLKSASAKPENLIIKSLRGERKIEYKDIDWIYEIALSNPTLISLKYKDKETGDSKKILIIPSLTSRICAWNFLEEHIMTKYIRKKINETQPDYTRSNEPSKWLPLGFFLLSGVPILLIIIIFS